MSEGSLNIDEIIACLQITPPFLMIDQVERVIPGKSCYAIKNGFMPVTMGNSVLRTDTAGIASIAAIQTLWGQ